ncbi:MAG: EF-hand domain-containing protein [archaeon]|nr:EF-hand domain-containing protein [archaeon]
MSSVPDEGNELRKIFEYELRRKLAMRAKTSSHEMIILINAFRFYDTNNLGTVTKEQWSRSFGKIGLNGFTEKDLSMLFDIYDTNKAGRINYKAFTNYLYEQGNSNEISPSDQPKNLNEGFDKNQPLSQSCSAPSKLEFKKYFKMSLDYLRSFINDKNGIIYYTLAQKIKSNEDQLRKIISFEDLKKSFDEISLNVDPKSLYEFFMMMDTSDEGTISTFEFLRLLRGNLDENRKMLIVQKFANLDSERKGFCDVELIKQKFNPNNHPEVLNGRKSPEEVYGEFCFMLDVFLGKIKGGETEIISFDDFIEFYHGISASIPFDGLFEEMINGVWDSNTKIPMNASLEERSTGNNSNTAVVRNEEDNSQSLIINNEEKIYTPKKTPQELRQNLGQGKGMPQNIRRTPLNKTPLQGINEATPNQSNALNPSNALTNPQDIPMYLPPSQRRTPLMQSQDIPRRTPINNLPPSRKRTPSSKMMDLPLRQKTPYEQQLQMQSPTYQPSSNSVRYRCRSQVRYNPINNSFIVPEGYNLSQIKSPSNSEFQPGENKTALGLPPQLEQIFQKIRFAIKQRGPSGLSAFLRLFKLVDRANKRNLSFDELEKIFNLFRVNLNYNELNCLFSSFDKNNLKLATYDDMVQQILGRMNSERENSAKNLFYKLNRGNTFVYAEDLQNINCSMHPDVLSGRKSEQQIYNEWLYNFEAYAEFYQITVRSWKISLDEFLNFFSVYSFCILDDSVFENILNSCWERTAAIQNAGINPNNGYNYRQQRRSSMGRVGELIMGRNNGNLSSQGNAGIIGRRF